MVLSGENQSETEVCRTRALMRRFHFLPTWRCKVLTRPRDVGISGFPNGFVSPKWCERFRPLPGTIPHDRLDRALHGWRRKIVDQPAGRHWMRKCMSRVPMPIITAMAMASDRRVDDRCACERQNLRCNESPVPTSNGNLAIHDRHRSSRVEAVGRRCYRYVLIRPP